MSDYIAQSKNLWLLYTGLNNPHKLIALSIYNWPSSTKFFYTLLWVLRASLHRIAASSVSRTSNYVPNRFDKNFVFFSLIFVLSFRHYYCFKLLLILFDFFLFRSFCSRQSLYFCKFQGGPFSAGRNHFGTPVICRCRPGGTNTAGGLILHDRPSSVRSFCIVGAFFLPWSILSKTNLFICLLTKETTPTWIT